MDTYNTIKNLMERMDRVELLMQDTIQQITDLADRLEPTPAPMEIIDPWQLSHADGSVSAILGANDTARIEAERFRPARIRRDDEGVEGIFDRDSDDE